MIWRIGMSQNKTGINRKDIVNKVKARKVEKKNFTFSMDKELMLTFQKETEKDGISMTEALTQMIKVYLGREK